jgi:hypothetical protein
MAQDFLDLFPLIAAACSLQVLDTVAHKEYATFAKFGFNTRTFNYTLGDYSTPVLIDSWWKHRLKHCIVLTWLSVEHFSSCSRKIDTTYWKERITTTSVGNNAAMSTCSQLILGSFGGKLTGSKA